MPQPKARANHNIPQHQDATFELGKRFIEAVIFTKNIWPRYAHDKYSTVDEASNRAIEDWDCQRTSAGAPVGRPSVCQLLGGRSLKIDPQTRQAYSLGFGSMLLYQMRDIDYTSQYT
jgi:hypothetical protein